VFINKLLVFLNISKEMIDTNNEYGSGYPMVAVRGFTMLLMMQNMEISIFYDVFERIIDLFAKSN